MRAVQRAVTSSLSTGMVNEVAAGLQALAGKQGGISLLTLFSFDFTSTSASVTTDLGR